MARLVLNVAAALLAASALYAHAASRELSCSMNVSDAEERAAMQKNVDVVARTGKHELTVKTAGKVLKFQDKPPYEVESEGRHYRFCDRDDGFILVYLLDEDVYTGVLINESTGLATKGGFSVLFSHDKRAYLAAEVPDGLDGSRWSIYAADGQLSWSGYSFIEKTGKDGLRYQAVQLSHPAWSATGEFSADAACDGDEKHTWRAKLIKSGGKWDWRPQKTCTEY